MAENALREERAGPDIAQIGDLVINPTIERALDGVREMLGMEVAYTTRIAEDRQVFQRVRGDAESFGLAENASLPLGETYCRKMLEGRLPNLIADVAADPRAAEMPVTERADVGAFATVPLFFSDGALYGTMCAASHEPKPAWGYHELQFLRVFARIVADQIERESLERRAFEVERKAHELEVQAAAATALIRAVEARDTYTGGHSLAVVDHAAAVADDLGLGDGARAEVKHVALLHDIGKIAVPDAILLKAGPLTPDEWSVMRTHPVESERLIAGVPGLRHLAPLIRAEHERWDGLGYPDGLAGEEIPLASRITLVCDAFHAMTSDRPYRRAMSMKQARNEIQANLGVQFCPSSGGALLDILPAS